MRIVIGIVLVAAGIILVLLSRKIYENMSAFPWAEDKFGPGGTLTLIRLVGLAGILLGFFIWVGLFELIFGGIFRTLFGGIDEPIEL